MVEIAEFLNESNMLGKNRIMYNVYESPCKRLFGGVPARAIIQIFAGQEGIST